MYQKEIVDPLVTEAGKNLVAVCGNSPDLCWQVLLGMVRKFHQTQTNLEIVDQMINDINNLKTEIAGEYQS